MYQKILIVCLVLLSNVVLAQRPKKFQVNGAARAYFFVNQLEVDEALDSVTTRKANYGHTLLDLGISVFPNKNTEVIGMFRIRNELGGFWGGGVSFNVRQLTVNGVAAGAVKYSLGDVDLKMTPYTLYNFQEEGVVNEGDVFSNRRDVVYYDMFYNNNQWRMQGATAQFGLEFDKGIKGLDVKGFLTRQRTTDGLSLPERLFGGGTVSIIQSENLSINLNSVNIFDLTETIRDSILYRNNVNTAQLRYQRSLNENISLGLDVEAGMSSARYINYSDPRAPDKTNEWFYDAAFRSDLKKQGLKLALGYKDIGADFLSPGAQTKRIDFSRFPGLYQQITNDAVGRPLSYTDFISGNTNNSFRISEELIPYFAAYNNTNPYGTATPNRRGIYLDAVRTDSSQFRESFLRVAALSQSRGTGTLKKKNFLLVEAGTDLYVNDFFGWKKQIKVDLGVRFENTSRSGAVYEEVALNSTFLDAGLSWEFAEKLDLMVGAKLWRAKGNEAMSLRNRFNTIENFEIVNYDFSENTYAAGLQYRFTEKNTLSAQYQIFNIDHKNDALTDYGIGQLTFLLNLNF